MGNFGVVSAGLLKKGLVEADNMVGKVAVATARTVKEAGTELKVLAGGLAVNLAVKALDIDAPFAGVGVNALVGIDSFLDNASDIAMLGAGASIGYKALKNFQAVLDENLTQKKVLEELGIAVDVAE